MPLCAAASECACPSLDINGPTGTNVLLCHICGVPAHTACVQARKITGEGEGEHEWDLEKDGAEDACVVRDVNICKGCFPNWIAFEAENASVVQQILRVRECQGRFEGSPFLKNADGKEEFSKIVQTSLVDSSFGEKSFDNGAMSSHGVLPCSSSQ